MVQTACRQKCCVIMTARNEDVHIRSAINSILSQTYSNFELVIIDDRSTDRTREVVRELARTDPRIILLCAGQSGRVACLNAAIAAARAPYLAIMDADDLAPPDRLALQCAFLDSHPGVVAVGGAVTYIGASETALCNVDDGRKITEKPAMPISKLEGLMMKPLPIMHSAAMMRREAVLEAGGYREALRHQEDTDLFLRLEEIGEVRNLPDVLHYYRQHAGNTSRRHFIAQCAARQLALVLARRRRLGLSDWAYNRGRAPTWGMLVVRDPVATFRTVTGTFILSIRQFAKRRKLLRVLEALPKPEAVMAPESGMASSAGSSGFIPPAEEAAR